MARVSALLLIALLGTSAPTLVRAQQSLRHPGDFSGSAACLDKLPADAFTRVPVYASVSFADSVSKRLRSSADNLLQDVAFHVQSQLRAPANVLPVGEPAVRWRDLDARLTVVAYRDGRLTRAVPSDRSDTTAAALLARAIDSLSEGSRLLDWSADSARDSIAFEVELLWPSPDRKHTLTPLRPKHPAVPIFSIAYPWALMAAQEPRTGAPRYPAAARDAGVTASVVVEFGVDTTGRAEEATIHDVWPNEKQRLTGVDGEYYNAFLASVKVALLKMRFYPAELGGCKVRQLVRMPFEFSLVPSQRHVGGGAPARLPEDDDDPQSSD